jgi:hypothetical protein
LPAFSSSTARSYWSEGCWGCVVQRRREQGEPGVDLTVIGKQVRLGHRDLESAIRMLWTRSRRQRERFAALFLFSRMAAARVQRRHGERRVDEALIASQRRVGVSIALGDVGEIEQRRVRGFVARRKVGEAPLRFRVVAALECEQRKPALDFALGGVRRANALQLEAGFFEPVERGENFRQRELTALGVEFHRLARGGDGGGAVAFHHIGARQNVRGRERCGVALARQPREILGALHVVGFERQLCHQRQSRGRGGVGVQRTADGGERGGSVCFLQEQGCEIGKLRIDVAGGRGGVGGTSALVRALARAALASARARVVIGRLRLQHRRQCRARFGHAIELQRHGGVDGRGVTVCRRKRAPAFDGIPRGRQVLACERHFAGAASHRRVGALGGRGVSLGRRPAVAALQRDFGNHGGGVRVARNLGGHLAPRRRCAAGDQQACEQRRAPGQSG